MKQYWGKRQGFALPTVVIASIVLMMVLAAVMSLARSTQQNIQQQNYALLAREAAESGIAFAKSCLEKSYATVTWSAAQPLRPNTDCNGGSACTDNANCYVVSNDLVKTTFEVGNTTYQGGATYTINVSAKTQLLRSSTKTVWDTYPYSDQQTIDIATKPVSNGLVLNLDAGDKASYTSGSTVWNDLSSKGNNGTLVGSVGYSAANGGALSFTGSGYVRIPNNSTLQLTGSQTLDFWIYPTNLAAGRQNILDKAYGGEFATTLETNGSMTAYYGTCGGQCPTYQGWTITPLVQNKWQEVTMVRDLSSMKVYTYINGTRSYIDSTLSAYLIAAYANAGASSYDVTLGLGYTGVYYNGLISSVRLYNRALSYSEVRQNFISQRDRYYTASQTSCLSILNAGLSTGSGIYTINPNGTPLSVYCDMVNDGGGWTLVLQNNLGVTTPSPTWNDSINSNNVIGTFTNPLTGFDQLVGLNYWSSIGTQLRIQFGNTPGTIVNKAMYSFYLDPTNQFSINLSNENVMLGGMSPGLYTLHNGHKWTTYDVDNDDYVGNNCASFYSNHPWWYEACWSGNFFAGGGYNEMPYWSGSGGMYGAYGSIWVR